MTWVACILAPVAIFYAWAVVDNNVEIWRRRPVKVATNKPEPRDSRTFEMR